MASYNKFDSFIAALADGKHQLGANTLKLALVNVAPTAADEVFADLTEITAQNGYVAGGKVMTTTSSGQVGGLYTLMLSNFSPWSAVGGAIGPFRYAVLYNDSATNKELIAWWDYGSSLTLSAGETFGVNFDQVTGVLTAS